MQTPSSVVSAKSGLRMVSAAILSVPLATQPGMAANAEVSTSDPIAIFNQVCLADRVQLSSNAFAAIQHEKLPRGARQALNFSLPAGVNPLPNTKRQSLPAAEVPNAFYQTRASKGTYLMLPAAPEQSGRAAAHCGVIWKGRHYNKALTAAQGLAPLPKAAAGPATGKYLPGFGYHVMRSQGAIIGVAEYDNWTVMRVAADTSQEEHSAQ